jgi:hypothetical protein
LIRKLIVLVALLALVAACSSSPSGESATASTAPTPTPTATPEPEASEPPASSGSGSDSAVLAMLPDQVGGMDHNNDIDFANSPIFANALAGTGVDASEVEYIVRSWGEGDVTLSAMRLPGMDEVQLRLFAQGMSGVAGTGASTETVTVGGKSVLRIVGDDVPAAAYMYFAEGTMFTVVSESQDLAAEVLGALP